MAAVDSLLNTDLPTLVDLGDGSREDLEKELQQVHNAIEILQAEIERIRLATGTAPPL